MTLEFVNKFNNDIDNNDIDNNVHNNNSSNNNTNNNNDNNDIGPVLGPRKGALYCIMNTLMRTKGGPKEWGS